MVVQINALVKANEALGLKGLIVFAAGPEQKAAIEAIATEHGITVPMVLPVDIGETLRQYGVNTKAKNTVMVSRSKKVLFNGVNMTSETFAAVRDAVRDALDK